MRRLGAQAVRAVCETELQDTVPGCVDTLEKILVSVDPKDIHGALLALSELAGSIGNSDARGSLENGRKKVTSVFTSEKCH